MTDEELFDLAKNHHDVEAENYLAMRYYEMRYALGEIALPGAIGYITPGEFNHLYFLTYMNVYSSYDPEKGSFKGFAIVTLHFDLLHSVREEKKRRATITSFDDNVYYGSERSDWTFHDIVPSENSEDPKAYCDLLDVVALIESASTEFDNITLEIVKLYIVGLTVSEIAKALKISQSKVRRSIRLYRDFMNTRFTKDNPKATSPSSAKKK